MNKSDAYPILTIPSSSTISEQRKEDRIDSLMENLFATTGVVAAGAFTTNMIAKNSREGDVFRRLFNRNVLDATMHETADGMRWADLFAKDEFGLGDMSLESMRKVEEFSPFRIARTLQLSHLMTPFALMDKAAIDITPDMVSMQEELLSAVLRSRGNHHLSDTHKSMGLRLQDGKLYEIGTDSKLGRVLLDNATIMMTHSALPKDEQHHELVYANKIARQYYTKITGSTADRFASTVGTNTAPFMIMGGKSKGQVAWDIFSSYGRTMMESGTRVLDKPFEQVLEMFPKMEGGKIHKFIDKMPNFNFGTGGQYRQSVPKSLLMMAKNQYKAVAAVTGFAVLNELMTDHESETATGLIPMIATAAVNIDIGYSELVSDHFQEYRDAQEYYAPGSTSLLTLGGVPMALGTALGTSSYLQRIYDNTRHGVDFSERQAEKLIKVVPENFGKMLPEAIASITMPRWKHRAILGFAAGTIMVAPFIPGALIGDSSEEKKAIYSGQKDIEIRKNRWWFTGSSSYEGDSIKYFDKHAYAKLMAQTNTVDMYGDSETKSALDPFLHPFDYLRDPYKLEKMHADDKPYSVWGMNISAGTFMGKAFEKTIGQIIKPDIINPRLVETIHHDSGGLKVHTDAEDLQDAISANEFSIETPVTPDEASLIAEGKLVAPAAATYSPNTAAAAWSWEAAKDFIGLRGWLIGVVEEGLDLPTTQLDPQLGRSGSMTNSGQRIKDQNLGGLFGLTEPQRRYVPTSAKIADTGANPIHNTMPSWLPGDEDRYWLNLQRGDAALLVEHAASRLPGDGYATLHEDVRGLSPEDYPDIHKLKILSDIAIGSDSYYNVRRRIESREKDGALDSNEYSMLADIRDKEERRSRKKTFSEYRTDYELQDATTSEKAYGGYWEGLSHGLERALPTEYLTFFRPAGKMLHKRTAIEDYERTQLEGPDTALWDKPIDHFISPALNSIQRGIDDEYIPDSVKEMRTVDGYFDRLEYIKQRSLYKQAVDIQDTDSARSAQAGYQKTLIGAQASGLDSDMELLRSYMALSSEEKPYFASFISATGKDRDKISSMESEDVSGIFQTIWRRRDTMSDAMQSGATIEEANEAVQQQRQEEVYDLISENQEDYNEYKKSNDSAKTSFTEYLADKDAAAYIDARGGVPDATFSGWDPRIDMKKIKLRALTIGGEDFHKYGFWSNDVKELERYTVINEDENIDRIAENMAAEAVARGKLKMAAKDMMESQGYQVEQIVIENGSGSVDIEVIT